ncbi:SPL family radical SAM protein [Metabacillus sp. RGM 3146]|uniref:SPL family radical SAM protein n=1 Tax=Metabacillus sp. RGM 3146 TaxID=3401092 RepID=UPI003B9C04B7
MEISYRNPKAFLTKTGGFLEGYEYSLNPYIGCSFGCKYCYVRKLPVSLFRKEEWGTWVDVKQASKESFAKELKKAKEKGPVRIFMSSSTDPYQGVESNEKITRLLLETMTEIQPDFLFVQTRSPLVKRDLDLFKKFNGNLLVSMTIETDREEIRKLFSPGAPPLKARMNALKLLTENGITTQAAAAPVLPYSDEFPKKLSGITNRVCLDDLFMGDGANGKRSIKLGMEELHQEAEAEEWFNRKHIHQVVKDFEKVFPAENIKINKEGFIPFQEASEKT